MTEGRRQLRSLRQSVVYGVPRRGRRRPAVPLARERDARRPADHVGVNPIPCRHDPGRTCHRLARSTLAAPDRGRQPDHRGHRVGRLRFVVGDLRPADGRHHRYGPGGAADRHDRVDHLANAQGLRPGNAARRGRRVTRPSAGRYVLGRLDRTADHSRHGPTRRGRAYCRHWAYVSRHDPGGRDARCRHHLYRYGRCRRNPDPAPLDIRRRGAAANETPCRAGDLLSRSSVCTASHSQKMGTV
jgi:hypothetical protein